MFLVTQMRFACNDGFYSRHTDVQFVFARFRSGLRKLKLFDQTGPHHVGSATFLRALHTLEQCFAVLPFEGIVSSRI